MVSVAEPPGQIFVFPLITSVGLGMTVTHFTALAVPRPALEPVTVKQVLEFTSTFTLLPVKLPGIQVYELAPVAVIDI